jgi:hypothetical protein
MKHGCRLAAVALVVAVVCASRVYAFDSWFERIRPDRTLSRGFPASETRAEVNDGFLLGTGSEIIRSLPDGRLRVERTRIYTRVRDTESGRIATFPEAWRVDSVLTVLPSLRLVAADTRMSFKRSGDTVFKGSRLSERHEWLFEVDRTRLIATPDGRRLSFERFKGTKRVESETYDYPTNAIPIELVNMFVSVAVQRNLDNFDFEMLLPGGTTHGVRAQTHRTRDLRRFAEGYRVAKSRLVVDEPLAVVDMHLASPLKYVFFPHHFFLAFSTREPWKLNLIWGGDPDENLQAYRID